MGDIMGYKGVGWVSWMSELGGRWPEVGDGGRSEIQCTVHCLPKIWTVGKFLV